MDGLNFLVLGIYIVAMVGIAIYARKKSRSLNDFLFAGKGLGGWMTAFAFGTTYFSSVILVGYSSKLGWDFGMGAIWIGIGNAILGGYMAWKVLARRTRVFTTSLESKTMPEYFEKRFGSSGLKLYASILIFVMLIPYSASVYQGLGYLFEYVFKIDFIWCVAIVAGLTGIYLFFGGYLATAISDFVQGIIMIVGVVIMVYFVYNNDIVGSFSKATADITEMGLGIFPKVNTFDLVILVLLTSFGIYGLPQSIHKFYAIKDEKAIRRGTVISTIFCAIIGICAYLVGAIGRLYFTERPEIVDTIVPNILISVLPAGLLGLVVILILSASMSTLSSLSLSGSSAFAIDVYKGYLNKNASGKKVKNMTKIMSVIFIAVSAFFAIAEIEAIVVIMSLSWGTLAGSFIGPYVLSLYSKKITKEGVWASFLTTLVVTISLITYFGITLAGGEGLFKIIKAGISKAPLIGVISMALSMIVTPLVSAFFKKKPECDQLFDKLADKIV